MNAPFAVSKILAEDGRPYLIAQGPPHRASGSGRRFADLSSRRLGPNAALLQGCGMVKMIAYSRDLWRNNAIVTQGIRRKASAIVGAGITPRSLAPEPALREAIHLWWDRWAESKDCDVEGRNNFYGMQKLVVRESTIAGEHFAIPYWRDDGPFPLQLKLCQSEMLDAEFNEMRERGEIRAGIELDDAYARLRYHFFKRHPYDCQGSYQPSDERETIDAAQVLHIFEGDEPGQLRGIPLLGRILLEASDLRGYRDGTLQRMIIASLFAAFIRKNANDATRGPLQRDPNAEVQDGDEDQPIFEPASMIYLNPGEEVEFPTTPDIGAGHKDVVRDINLAIAAGIGVPYEDMLGDVSDSNYTTIRAQKITSGREYRQMRATWLNPQLNTPVYKLVIEAGILAGAIPLRWQDYVANQTAILACKWIPDVEEWVDPLKDVLAEKEALAAGLQSVVEAIEKKGRRAEEVFREMRDANKLAESYGLHFDWMTDPQATADNATGDNASDAAAAQRIRRRKQRNAERRALVHQVLADG